MVSNSGDSCFPVIESVCLDEDRLRDEMKDLINDDEEEEPEESDGEGKGRKRKPEEELEENLDDDD